MENISNSIPEFCKTDIATQKMAEKFAEKASEMKKITSAKSKKSDYRLSGIIGKMRRGSRLSFGDLNYLRQKNPGLHAKAARAQAARDDFEAELRLCKDKEDVRRLQAKVTTSAISGGGISSLTSCLGGVSSGSVSAEAAAPSVDASLAVAPSAVPAVTMPEPTVNAAEITHIAEMASGIGISEPPPILDTNDINSTDNNHHKDYNDLEGAVGNYRYRCLSRVYFLYKQSDTYHKLPQKFVKYPKNDE